MALWPIARFALRPVHEENYIVAYSPQCLGKPERIVIGIAEEADSHERF
jgi:hypothetical protein